MHYTKFQGSQFLVSGPENFLKFFCLIRWSSWSLSQNHLNKLQFPISQEAEYEMQLKLAQGLLGRSNFECEFM